MVPNILYHFFTIMLYYAALEKHVKWMKAVDDDPNKDS
jgi:hypothetical protein